MKYLLLSVLVLSSCGKNKSPPKDMKAFENRSFTSSKKLSIADLYGKMRILSEAKVVSVEFSTGGTNKVMLNLLSQGKNSLLHVPGENSLHLTENVAIFSTPTDYPIRLSFLNENPESNSSLMYEDNSSQRIIQSWSKEMEFYLSQEEINKILRGEAHFRLVNSDAKDFSDNIDSNHYKVVLENDEIISTHLVSNKLSINTFLNNNNISKAQNVEEIDLGFQTESSEASWWYRKLDDTTYIVKSATLTDLKNSFLGSLEHQNGRIVRTDGDDSNFHSVKLGQSKAYFILRWQRRMRNFEVYKKQTGFGSNKVNPGDIEQWLRCTTTFRKESGTEVVQTDARLVLEKLELDLNGKKLRLNDVSSQIEIGKDSGGGYIKFGLKTSGGLGSFRLNTITEDKNIGIGAIKAKCNKGINRNFEGKQISQEASLTMTIESYIGK